MSALLTRERARRWAVQLAVGLSAGFALGMAVREARAKDTAASLLADPKRLEAVQQGCRTNQPWATDALCRQAAEAIRRRFRGGGVPYHPRRTDPFPSHPHMRPTPAAPKSTPSKPEAHQRQGASAPSHIL